MGVNFTISRSEGTTPALKEQSMISDDFLQQGQ